jgi:hypothetical protein
MDEAKTAMLRFTVAIFLDILKASIVVLVNVAAERAEFPVVLGEGLRKLRSFLAHRDGRKCKIISHGTPTCAADAIARGFFFGHNPVVGQLRHYSAC